MTSLKPLPWSPASVGWRTWSKPARRVTAAGLQIASAALGRLAVYVAVPIAEAVPRPLSPPLLEYHADAGASEGALYIDGELVGWLSGVRRL